MKLCCDLAARVNRPLKGIMNNRTFKRWLGGIFFAIALPGLLFAHSGGLDANGGHHNRKTGEYHYHQNKPAATPSTAPTASQPKAQHPVIASAVREQRLNNYFRQANENVGALSCNQVKHERNVTASVKEHIKQRDGFKCVICGNSYKLEVDHKRALMNGGSNSTSNLATLCDDCHTEKTRMDNSLRRKRKKLCRI